MVISTQWPTTVDDGTTLPVAADRVLNPLDSAMSSNQLTVPMGAQISEYPVDGGTTLIGTELIRYNSKSGADLVVDVAGRAYHGTTAVAHAEGDDVLLPPSADAINAIRSATIAIENYLGTTGSFNLTLQAVTDNGPSTTVALTVGGLTLQDSATDTISGIIGDNLLDKAATETVSGAWTFSSVVVGVTPTLAAHLATKSYVDSSGGSQDLQSVTTQGATTTDSITVGGLVIRIHLINH